MGDQIGQKMSFFCFGESVIICFPVIWHMNALCVCMHVCVGVWGVCMPEFACVYL